jgi:transposase InsO family protein
MSRTGDCWDHAVVARFFGSLQGERTSLCHEATPQEARDDVLDDLERCYHSTRVHVSLGDVRPTHFARFATVAYQSVRFPLTIT